MEFSTKDMPRDEWLKHRQAGIGGSDAGAILGLNKWKSPFQVYIEKTEPVQDRDTPEAAYWGNTLEDVVAKEFTKRTGKKVRRNNHMLKHKDYPWMLANIDREVVGESAILECKTANAFMAKEWDGDEVPASYIIQVQHYLAVTGAEKGYIAVLIGGQKFIYKEIPRDEELISQIISTEKTFWEDHVSKGVPPAMDGSSAAEKFLKERYPESDPEKSIALESSYDDLLEVLDVAKENIGVWTEKANEIENTIKNRMGDAESAYTNKKMITWKSVTSNRLDSKALKKDHPEIAEKYTKESLSRRFTIKNIQEA